MTAKTWYYGRVSSQGQNLARQIEAFKALGADDRDIITDKASGKNTDREGYKMLKERLLRDGDTLVIKSLDRLSRNKEDTAEELKYFKDHNIRLKVIDIPTTMIEFADGVPEGQSWVFDMVNNILIEVLSSMAQQERETIKKRQREGIDAMERREDGKRISSKTGRPVGRPELTYPENWEEVTQRLDNHEITAVQAMKELDMTKTSFYKLRKRASKK